MSIVITDVGIDNDLRQRNARGCGESYNLDADTQNIRDCKYLTNLGRESCSIKSNIALCISSKIVPKAVTLHGVSNGMESRARSNLFLTSWVMFSCSDESSAMYVEAICFAWKETCR